MPVWVVELFGNQQLNRAFWLINGMVAPFWVVMMLMPYNKWIRRICHPFFVPALLSLFYLYMIYILITTTGIPPLAGLEVRGIRKFIDHPIIFLVIWAHYMTVDLFLGMSIYQHASRKRLRIPVELLLCWLFGPAGLAAYMVRLAFHYGSVRGIWRALRR